MKKLIAIVLGALFLPMTAQAGLYWNHGVRASSISVCFVGDAVTSRPDRVNEILQDLNEYEYAANVRFNYTGTCSPPSSQANGDDYYDGDIRVILPYINVSGTGMVPGDGCPMFQENGSYNGENDDWGSWSNAPDDLGPNRACLYNLKLGDDPWNSDPYLNHTLHEFGHALGLAHEHKRADVDAGCTESGYGGGATSYMTEYDTNSVMHYKFSSCGINGNYDTDGLSDEDRLSVHVLYPEASRVAEFVGNTVIRTTDMLYLDSAWDWRGGYMGTLALNHAWVLGRTTYSTLPYLYTSLAAGQYGLGISYLDILGRLYTYSGTVTVLTPTDYDAQISGPIAAQL